MADNIHPVVELLAARMETHPEEFKSGRWAGWMTQMEGLLTEEERLLLRRLEMQEIHEEVLDELLNGDQRRAERRALEEKERELQMQRYQQQYQQATMQPGQFAQVPSSALGQLSMGTLSQAATLNIGGETLDAGLIKKIKGALGL